MESTPLIGKRLRWWKQLTIEPATILFFTSMYMSDTLEAMMLLDKACTKQYGNGTCASETEAQVTVSGIDIWKPTLRTLSSTFLSIYVGIIADKNPRSLVTLVHIPTFFRIINDVCNCLNITIWHWAPVPTAVLQTVIVGLSGYYLTTLIVILVYITIITSDDNRTIRLVYASSAISIGLVLGTVSSGYAATYLSITGGFIVSILINVASILTGFIFIKSPEAKNDTGVIIVVNNSTSSKFFSPFIDTIKEKEKEIRIMILFALIGWICTASVATGEISLTYLYTRYAFNFTPTEFSNYSFFRQAGQFIGVLITAEIFQRYMKLSDATTSIIECISVAIASLILIFVDEIWQLYLFTSFQMFQTSVTSISISWMTKQFEVHDYGKVGIVFGILHVPLSFSFSIYNAVYKYTFVFQPGAFFSVSFVFMLIASITFVIAAFYERKHINQLSLQRQDRKSVIIS